MASNDSYNEIHTPEILRNVNLAPYNTLQVEALAERFVILKAAKELPVLFKNGNFTKDGVWVLGGGSNVLFQGRVQPLVLKNEIKELEVLDEDEQQVRIRSGAGMDWHQLVTYCVNQKWQGVENLALIPGTVGAAPIQNIGAYGVEVGEVFESLQAFDLQKGTFRTFEKEECDFGYRDSVFKNRYKNRFVITSVVLRLNKPPYSLNTEYQSLKKWLDRQNITNPSLEDVFRAVVAIRTDKLPNPGDLGNAGSFFKNPVITRKQFVGLKNSFPSIPFYSQPDNKIKIPAGWLIEQTGWKGKRTGNVGTYENQALVIVNHGGATGQEIWDLAQKIRTSVHKKFGIELVPEVNIVGRTNG
ncbi:MAG: UDP-N-acetylmuramate dehydrogenase [Balneolaceae bacterium]